MPDRTPTCLIRGQHASAETNMPQQRPTCLSGDQHSWSQTHQSPTCLIGDPYALLETHWRPTCLIGDPKYISCPGSVSYQACRSPMGYWSGRLDGSLMRHVGLRWVSDEACRSLMGLRWGMSVSDEACRSPMRHVRLRWGMSVYDGSPIRQVGLWWVSDRIFVNSWKS